MTGMSRWMRDGCSVRLLHVVFFSINRTRGNDNFECKMITGAISAREQAGARAREHVPNRPGPRQLTWPLAQAGEDDAPAAEGADPQADEWPSRAGAGSAPPLLLASVPE